MKEFGVFLPIANGGWIVSKATPPLDGGWEQNRDAALLAEEQGFDFVMAMASGAALAARPPIGARAWKPSP